MTYRLFRQKVLTSSTGLLSIEPRRINLLTVMYDNRTNSVNIMPDIITKGELGWLDIKMSSYCGDKTILLPSCSSNGISFTGKTTCSYSIRTQAMHWFDTVESHHNAVKRNTISLILL